MTGIRLELAFDEYVHMLERVAPWLLADAEETLRPFCHWLYARDAFDVPLAAVDEAALRAYAADAGLDARATAALREAIEALQRFAGQHLHST